MMYFKRAVYILFFVAVLMIYSGCGNTYEVIEPVSSEQSEAVSFDSYAARTDGTVSFSDDIPKAANPEEPTAKSTPDFSYLTGSYRFYGDGKMLYVSFYKVSGCTVYFCVGCLSDGEYSVFETETVIADVKDGKLVFSWTDNWFASGSGEIDLSKAPETVGLTVLQTSPGNAVCDPLTTDGKTVMLTK